MEALFSGLTGNQTTILLFCDLCNAELSLDRERKNSAMYNAGLTKTQRSVQQWKRTRSFSSLVLNLA